MPLTIIQLPLGPMENFSYLVADSATCLAAVIDPGWEPQAIVDAATQRGWTIQQIWLTHSHFDHVAALEELCTLAAPQAIFVHASEIAQLPNLATPIVPLQEATMLEIGAEKIHCLHTPGHSPGGTCFLWDGHCITGDTLFVGACGRVDLPGSDPEAMYASLRRLAALPGDTIVYPGHNYGDRLTSTIAHECATNQFIQAATQGMPQFYARRGV